MAFLLDANAFIEAKKRYYAFDICPGYWDFLDRQAAAGQIVSIEAVRDEILERDDDLAAWAKVRPELFPGTTPDQLPHLQTLAAWVRDQSYQPAAIADFLSSADYYLIAAAMAGGHTLVTLELPAPAAKKRVKIPEPCVAHNVAYINPFVMLRRLGARFTLATP
jgi:hypothetical protein